MNKKVFCMVCLSLFSTFMTGREKKGPVPVGGYPRAILGTWESVGGSDRIIRHFSPLGVEFANVPSSRMFVLARYRIKKNVLYERFGTSAPTESKIMYLDGQRLVLLEKGLKREKRHVWIRVDGYNRVESVPLPVREYLQGLQGRWYVFVQFMRTGDRQWMHFADTMAFTGKEGGKRLIRGIYSLDRDILTVRYSGKTVNLKILAMNTNEILFLHDNKPIVFSRNPNCIPDRPPLKPVMLPGDETGAARLVALLTKKETDYVKTILRLRPSHKDYLAFYASDELADIAWKADKVFWETAETAPHKRNPFVRFTLRKTTTDKFHEKGAHEFAGGYYSKSWLFRRGITVYSFKLYRSGSEYGFRLDCFVYLNGHWVLFPKAYSVGDKVPVEIRKKYKGEMK